VPEVMQDRFPK